MKTLKIKFIDQWPGFPGKDSFIYKLINKDYNIELSDTPDYVIDAGNGYDHLNYDCVKIFWNGENIIPDFNSFDYAMGFDHLQFGDRYERVPHFVLYREFAGLKGGARKVADPKKLLERGFCSFVVSNGNAVPLREYFYKELSKYKPIASGGRYLNNVGGPVPDKLAFCSQYKFNIAIENSISPGYTTEKIMQPLTVNSVPIYYGNPTVETDFLEGCMVRIKDKNDVERAIETVIALDKDDDRYLQMAQAPCLTMNSPEYYFDKMSAFLRNILLMCKIC